MEPERDSKAGASGREDREVLGRRRGGQDGQGEGGGEHAEEDEAKAEGKAEGKATKRRLPRKTAKLVKLTCQVLKRVNMSFEALSQRAADETTVGDESR